MIVAVIAAGFWIGSVVSAVDRAPPSSGALWAGMQGQGLPSRPESRDDSVLDIQEPDRHAVGRVVDASREPLDGVEVTITCAGQVVGTARSASGGRFKVAIQHVPHPEGQFLTLHAALPQAGARAEPLWMPKGAQVKDVGTLLLEPAEDVTVRVVQGGEPVPGARVVCWWASGPHPLRDVATDSSGTAVFPQMPATSSVRFLASEVLGSRAAAELSLPRRDPSPLVLSLAPGRDVEVTMVDAATGTPIPGAQVVPWMMVEELGAVDGRWAGKPSPPTDANGVTVARGLRDSDSLTVRADGYHERVGRGRVMLPRGACSVSVELKATP
jgi:hypothetical protein